MPFLISLLGGLRPAETFALCFDDIDCKSCTISINKQIVEESSGKMIIKQPKTEKSTRVVEVPLVVIQEVIKRRDALIAAQKENPVLFEQNKRKFIDGREFREDIIEQPNFQDSISPLSISEFTAYDESTPRTVSIYVLVTGWL